MIHRRNLLRLAAGLPFLGLAGPASAAQAALIERLIAEAKPLPRVAERIDYISGKLLSIRYRANTLIGGPAQPEKFVVRDDAFDCVTFCETVLAAARSYDFAEFETALRRIRYDHGNVQYDQRNHYFADWSLNNIANGVCRAVVLPDTAVVEKTVSYMHGLPVERVGLTSVPVASVLANAERLATGDIVGFLSRRPGIDYFHTGVIVVGEGDALMLRHAAKSRGRVLDQKLSAFIAENGVRHVSLLRPQEVWSGDAIV